MSNHFLSCLKAYASLVGVIATALVATYGSGEVGHALTAAAGVATAVSVWAVPNKTPQKASEKPVEAPSSPAQPPAG